MYLTLYVQTCWVFSLTFSPKGYTYLLFHFNILIIVALMNIIYGFYRRRDR